MINITYAQNQVDFSKKGRVLIEAGYNLFSGFAGGTGASVFSTEGSSIISFGFDGGYFISENFALKFRLGLLNTGGESLINISGGGKYYIANQIPIELGAGIVTAGGGSAFLGNATVGYGIKLAPNINLEPSIGVLYSGTALFKGGINFAMFL